jgi:hypothetical protein
VAGNSILRRDVLRSLGIGLAAGSAARVIPPQAAEYAHKVIREEKTPKGSYQPKFFTAHHYKTPPTPDGADIYTDGAFVGNAPATLKLSPGKHTIRLTLAGYQDWSCDITALTGSEAPLIANFQKHCYRISQKNRERIEECFGWLKTIALLRKVRHRGTLKVPWIFALACAAYNLVRMRILMRSAVPAQFVRAAVSLKGAERPLSGAR